MDRCRDLSAQRCNQHHRRSGRIQFSRVGVQSLQPSELIIEFGTGLGVSIGSVDRGDEHAVDGRFEIAALAIGDVARQVHASDHRCPSHQNRHAVPAPLAAPDRTNNRPGRERLTETSVSPLLWSSLKAHNVRVRFAKPVQRRSSKRRLMLLILKLAIFISAPDKATS